MLDTPSVSLRVQPPEIELAPGELKAITVFVENNGDLNLDSLILTTKDGSCEGGPFDVADGAVAEGRTCTVSRAPSQQSQAPIDLSDGEVFTTVEVKTANGDRLASSDIWLTATPPALSMELTDAPDVDYRGRTATARVSVSNAGPVDVDVALEVNGHRCDSEANTVLREDVLDLTCDLHVPDAGTGVYEFALSWEGTTVATESHSIEAVEPDCPVVVSDHPNGSSAVQFVDGGTVATEQQWHERLRTVGEVMDRVACETLTPYAGATLEPPLDRDSAAAASSGGAEGETPPGPDLPAVEPNEACPRWDLVASEADDPTAPRMRVAPSADCSSTVTVRAPRGAANPRPTQGRTEHGGSRPDQRHSIGSSRLPTRHGL